MAIKGKKIFLTGGAGFIGSELIGRLIENNEIIIYDNLRRCSVQYKPFYRHQNLKIIKGDILDVKRLRQAIKGSDIVVHLAGIAGINTVIKSPIATMKVNMLGTANVLEAAITLGHCERFIFFSTSEVFGTRAYRPEESDVTHLGAVGEARWTYAVSKLAGEHLAHSYYKEFNLPVVSVRPFNVYGPGQVGEGAIHTFIKQAIRNKDILVYGDGNQIRSWCYIDDMVCGVILCLEKKECIGNVFNIGNPRSTITIYSLASTIVEIAHSRSQIKFIPKNSVDVELRTPSIEKAKKILGYQPKVELEDGIRRTIDWYRNQLK